MCTHIISIYLELATLTFYQAARRMRRQVRKKYKSGSWHIISLMVSHVKHLKEQGNHPGMLTVILTLHIMSIPSHSSFIHRENG